MPYNFQNYDRDVLSGLDRKYNDPRFAASALSRANPEQLAILAENPGVMAHPVLGDVVRSMTGQNRNPYSEADTAGGVVPGGGGGGLINQVRDVLDRSDSRDFVTRAADALKGVNREGSNIDLGPDDFMTLSTEAPGTYPTARPASGVTVPIQPWDEPGYPASIGPQGGVPRAPGGPLGGRALPQGGSLSSPPAAAPAIVPGGASPAGLPPVQGPAPVAPGGGALGAVPMPVAADPENLSWQDLLIQGGLGMMQSGSQPGQSFLGALGAGMGQAYGANKEYLGQQKAAAQQEYENQLKRREMELQQMRAEAAQQRANQAGRETVTLANGNIGIVDKNTGKIQDLGQQAGGGALGSKDPAMMQIAKQFMAENPSLTFADAYSAAQGQPGRERLAMIELRSRVLDNIKKDPMNYGMSAEELNAELNRQMQAVIGSGQSAEGQGTGDEILTVDIPGPPVAGQTVVDGYVYQGGDPNDEANWSKVP